MHSVRAGKRTLGVVGGLGDLAGVDLFTKLLRSPAVLSEQDRYHFLLQQDPFTGSALPLESGADLRSRMFYVFQACQALSRQAADAVLLPCFASHTFRDQLQAELDVPVVDMMVALHEHVTRALPSGGRVGVLCSDFVRDSGLFERCLGSAWTICYPSAAEQTALMAALYGHGGIKAGALEGQPLDDVHQICLSLCEQGVDLLLPGTTELCLLATALLGRGTPIVDANRVYADYALHAEVVLTPPPFKLGLVGGVGPAATVDFLDKLVRNTPAQCDQDHIRMVVEHNPQIPDRTGHLLYNGPDPSLALYAMCKRLEEEGAHAIAIPCNTAHAFVERIQPSLSIPVVHMLDETVRYIRDRFGVTDAVGLLATSGTVRSGLYQTAAEGVGLHLLTPAFDYQERIMRAIYGEHGIKAGHTDGLCRRELLAAARHLVEQGARILILGCTELPLVLRPSEELSMGESPIVLVDPTEVLAQRCVALAVPDRGALTQSLTTQDLLVTVVSQNPCLGL